MVPSAMLANTCNPYRFGPCAVLPDQSVPSELVLVQMPGLVVVGSESSGSGSSSDAALSPLVIDLQNHRTSRHFHPPRADFNPAIAINAP
jgi:hypothetical protein